MPRRMEPAAFRSEFPVLQRMAYLNAGTDGPIPRRAAQAARVELERELEQGRAGRAHYARLLDLRSSVRSRLAALVRCEPAELALTHSTTDGLNTVLWGLELGRGDEVLTTDEEHPGLLAPLAAAQRRRGFGLRVVPFGEVAGEVGAKTRLVACSHVSWVSGQVVDAPGLASTGAAVLLDGAQGLGALELDLRRLGCDYYAAAGQKWLCGPDGTGCLYARAPAAEALAVPWPGYESLSDPARALELPLHPDARRLDVGPSPAPLLAWWLASIELLGEAGWGWVTHRGPELAGRFAGLLAERGAEVTARGESTLVSWGSTDAEADSERLAGEGIVIRHLPGRGLLRASVGAWSSEEELERLVALVG